MLGVRAHFLGNTDWLGLGQSTATRWHHVGWRRLVASKTTEVNQINMLQGVTDVLAADTGPWILDVHGVCLDCENPRVRTNKWTC